MEPHWNESQVTKSMKEVKAVYSKATLDAQTLCFTTVRELKAACIVAVKEAKTAQASSIQEAKAACSTTIRDAKALWACHAEVLQREHGNIMQDLEMQPIQEESKVQADFLSPCQAALYASPAELKSTLVTSYNFLLRQTPLSHPFVPLQRASPSGGTSHFSHFPYTSAQAVS